VEPDLKSNIRIRTVCALKGICIYLEYENCCLFSIKVKKNWIKDISLYIIEKNYVCVIGGIR